MRRTNFLFMLIALAMALLAACSSQVNTEQDVIEIRKVMEQRARAIVSKDIELYQSLFVVDYYDGHYRLPELIDDMRDNFQKYSKITLTFQRAPVELKMNSARVIQRLVYHAEGLDKPIHNHEKLLLRRIEGKWYISGGVQIGLF